MTNLSTVSLTSKGEVKKVNLTLSSEATITLDTLQKFFKKKDKPEKVANYEYDRKVIFVFGYVKGKKGTESKAVLPEPFDEIKLFGDAIVLASTNDSWDCPVPFTTDQWNQFIQEDEEQEDDEEEEEEEEDQEDVLSTADDESVKDDYDESDSDNSIDEKGDIEEIEEADEVEQPVVAKKRRAPVYNKVDTNALKEEIDLLSEPESQPLRIKALSSFTFLEEYFPKETIRLLEKNIFEASYHFAQKQYIARTWKSPQFIEIYRQILRSTLFNLHPESPVKNQRLLKRVIDGEFSLESIPHMTSYELFPENWFELKDKLLQREQKILEGNKSRATDQFKCRRCHKSECTYYELQTRSADEPMTIFITCLNCGKEWRQGG
jgi:transcription elongation factor S-II